MSEQVYFPGACGECHIPAMLAELAKLGEASMPFKQASATPPIFSTFRPKSAKLTP